MKMPEWLSTLMVMLNESWLWVILALLVSLLIVRFIWSKLRRTASKVLVLLLTIPLSTGVGFISTANALADEYQKSDNSISKLYENKKAELFDSVQIGTQK